MRQQKLKLIFFNTHLTQHECNASDPELDPDHDGDISTKTNIKAKKSKIIEKEITQRKSMSSDKATLSAKSSNENIDNTNKSNSIILKLTANDSALTRGMISPKSTTMICVSPKT